MEKGQLKFDIEDLEVKHEKLESEKATLESKLEETYADTQELRKTNDDLQNKEKIRALESTKKLKFLEKALKDYVDEVAMLESTVKNRDIKIEIHEKKIDSCETVKLDSCKQTKLDVNCFECDQCEHKDEDEQRLKQHIKQYHEIKCDKCSETFPGLRKINNHMCRVQLKDPEYLDLHYEKCWVNKDFCSEIPEDVDTS